MTLTEKARILRPLIEKAAANLDTEDALTGLDLFPLWKPEQAYIVGQRLRYNNTLYSVIQAHTSQESWKPDTAASLYAKVLIPDADVIPEWEQPGATNAYMRGDTVRYNGKVYRSLIDNNVWSPADYPAGWEEVTE